MSTSSNEHLFRRQPPFRHHALRLQGILIRELPLAAKMLTACLGSSHSRSRVFADEATLELGDRSHDTEEKPAGVVSMASERERKPTPSVSKRVVI
jgi:hypothetical protein